MKEITQALMTSSRQSRNDAADAAVALNIIAHPLIDRLTLLVERSFQDACSVAETDLNSGDAVFVDSNFSLTLQNVEDVDKSVRSLAEELEGVRKMLGRKRSLLVLRRKEMLEATQKKGA